MQIQCTGGFYCCNLFHQTLSQLNHGNNLPGESFNSIVTFLQEDYEVTPDDRERAFLLSIGAPSLLYYQYTRDDSEYLMTRKLYIKTGLETPQTVFGPFDFTPSFIKRLERIMRADTTSYPSSMLTQYDGLSPEKRRKKRVGFMNFPVAHIIYLSVIRNFLEKEHRDFLESCSETDKLHFMATAYKLRLVGSTGEIMAQSRHPVFFEDHENLPAPDFTFGDAAVAIYERLTTWP